MSFTKVRTALICSLLLMAWPLTSSATSSNVKIINANNNSNNQQLDWDDDWEEEIASPWQINGFIEAAYGQFLQSNALNKTSPLKELRMQLSLDYEHQAFTIKTKADSYYDQLQQDLIWQTRALNVQFSLLDSIDIKLGRQVLTWGTGDYLFINDLFAKDWQSFFAGRSDEYLKAPSDSIKASWFGNNNNFTLVWTPNFTADNFIRGQRFVYYDTLSQQITGRDFTPRLKNNSGSQWAARYNTHWQNIEFSLYGYHGYWTTPQGQNPQQQAYFPRLNSWGVSATTTLLGGIFNAEYGKYISVEDAHGRKASIANSQQRLLLGYEHEVLKNLTMSGQYYVEKTDNHQRLMRYSTTPAQLVDKYRQLLTLRLTYQSKQQTIRYSLFAFYSPTDKDSYLKPSIDYRHNDQWLLSLGANLFSGKNHYSFFGQHQDNSNAWLRVRYQY